MARVFRKETRVGNFLAEINEEIEKILLDMDTLEGGPDLDGGPVEEMEDGDHVLGECGPEVKALWCLREKYAKEIQKVRGELLSQFGRLLSSGSPPDKLTPDSLGAVYKMEVLTSKIEAVGNLMWTQLKSDFPDTVSKPSVGIRKGWTAIWSEPTTRTDVLREILGI